MKVIISTDLSDSFSSYIVVNSFKDVLKIKNIDVLIIHSYKESDFDAGVHISSLSKKGLKYFIYINKKENKTLNTILAGVNSYIYDDEFYFEDEEELDSLVNDITQSSAEECTSLTVPAFNVLNDFIKAFEAGDSRIKAPLYLEQVTDSINTLTAYAEQQETRVAVMGKSTLAILDKASALIKQLSAQHTTIQKQLEELEASNMNLQPSKPSFSNNIMFFSTFNYTGNARVLVIREYAPCRYLTSFTLGYLHHLKYVKHKNPKLIFVHQKGKGVASKYNDFTSITEENKNIGTLYDNSIIATNSPKREIMKDLLSTDNDVFVIVDRLYGAQDIISGRVTKVNAVGSRSDIERYKIKPENTIFSVTSQPVQLFCLPTIKNFPLEHDMRQVAYVHTLSQNYEILDKKLGLEG